MGQLPPGVGASIALQEAHCLEAAICHNDLPAVAQSGKRHRWISPAPRLQHMLACRSCQHAATRCMPCALKAL